MNIIAVPPSEVRQVARFIRPLIEKACSRGCATPPDELIADAEERDAVLWLASDGAIPLGVCFTRLTRIETGEMAVWVSVLGGQAIHLWGRLLRARLHQFKDAEGADLLVWIGRRGWSRWVPPVGLDPEGYWIFEER